MMTGSCSPAWYVGRRAASPHGEGELSRVTVSRLGVSNSNDAADGDGSDDVHGVTFSFLTRAVTQPGA